jgi:hypothetical protein
MFRGVTSEGGGTMRIMLLSGDAAVPEIGAALVAGDVRSGKAKVDISDSVFAFPTR